MRVDVSTALKAALSKLTAEKRRIERQAAAIQAALRAVNGSNGEERASRARGIARTIKRGRRRMSSEQRKAVARRMKAYWAQRRGKAMRGRGKAA